MNNSPIKTVYCEKSSGFSYTVFTSSIEFHKDGVSFCTLPSGWFKNAEQFEEAAYELLICFSSLYREAKHRHESELVTYHTNAFVEGLCNGDF